MPVLKTEIRLPNSYESSLSSLTEKAREIKFNYDESLKKGETLPFKSFIEREVINTVPIEGVNKSKYTHADLTAEVLKTLQDASQKKALDFKDVNGVVHPSTWETGGVYQGFVGGKDTPGERKVFQYIGDHANDPNTAWVRTRPDMVQTNPSGMTEGFDYGPITMASKDTLTAYKKIGKQDLSGMKDFSEEYGSPAMPDFKMLTKLNDFMKQKEGQAPEKAFVPNNLGLYAEGQKKLVYMINPDGKKAWVPEEMVPQYESMGAKVSIRKDGVPTTRILPMVKDFTLTRSKDGTRHVIEENEIKLGRADLKQIRDTLKEQYGISDTVEREKPFLELEKSPAGKPIKAVKDAPSVLRDKLMTPEFLEDNPDVLRPQTNVLDPNYFNPALMSRRTIERERTKRKVDEPLMEVQATEWPGRSWYDSTRWPENINKGTWYQNPVKIGHVYDSKGNRHMLLYHPQGGFMTNHGFGVKVPVKERLAFEKMLRAMGKPIPWGETKAPVEGKTANVWFKSGENSNLSNLASRPFEINGKKYLSVEHAYQTLKSGTFDEATYNKYKQAGVKIEGTKKAKTEGNWNIKLMKKLMEASFEQNPKALAELKATRGKTLTHAQAKDIWGKEFPRLLTEIRDADIAKTSPSTGTIKKEPMKYSMPKGSNIWDRSTTTIDEIISGNRTSTTRGYWHNGTPKVGDIIEFEGNGKTVKVQIDSVEKMPQKPDMAFRKQWEATEGWDMAYAYKKGYIKPGDDIVRYHKVEGTPTVKEGLKLKKIISGGQTGGDRAGLEAGRKLGLETGGTVPKGFRTDKGSDKSLAEFGVEEHKSSEYAPRTEYNVIDSDGTVIYGNPDSPGCKLTRRLAEKYGRPIIINPKPEELRAWAIEKGIETLNVAGNRESKNPGIQGKVEKLLVQAFQGAEPEQKMAPTNTPLQKRYAGIFPDDMGKLKDMPPEHQAGVWAHLLDKGYAEISASAHLEPHIILTERGVSFLIKLGVKLSSNIAINWHGVNTGRPFIPPRDVAVYLKEKGYMLPEKWIHVRSDRVDRFRASVRDVLSDVTYSFILDPHKEQVRMLGLKTVPEPKKAKIREYLDATAKLMEDGMDIESIQALAMAERDRLAVQPRFQSAKEYLETYGIMEEQQVEKRRIDKGYGPSDYSVRTGEKEGEWSPSYDKGKGKGGVESRPTWYEEGTPRETPSPTTLPGYGSERVNVNRTFEGTTKAEGTKLEKDFGRSPITSSEVRPPVMKEENFRISHAKGHEKLFRTNLERIVIDKNATGERVVITSGIEGDKFKLYEKLKEEHLQDVLEGFEIGELELGTPLMDHHINTYRNDPRFSHIVEANIKNKADRYYSEYKESVAQKVELENMGVDSRQSRQIEMEKQKDLTGDYSTAQEAMMATTDLWDKVMETDGVEFNAIGDPFMSLVGKLINSMRDPGKKKAFMEIMNRMGDNAVKASAMNMSLYEYTVQQLKDTGIVDIEARRMTHNFMIGRDEFLNPSWDSYLAVRKAQGTITSELARERGVWEKMSTATREFNENMAEIFGKKGELWADWTNKLLTTFSFYRDAPPELRASIRTELIGAANYLRNAMHDNYKTIFGSLSSNRELEAACKYIELRDELEMAKINEKKFWKFRRGGEFVPNDTITKEWHMKKLIDDEASKTFYAWMKNERASGREVDKATAQAQYADIREWAKVKIESNYELPEMRREKAKEIRNRIADLRVEFEKTHGTDKWKYVEQSALAWSRLAGETGQLLASTTNPRTGTPYLSQELVRSWYAPALISSWCPTVYDKISIPKKMHAQIMAYTKGRSGHVIGDRMPLTPEVLTHHLAMVEYQIKLDRFLYETLEKYDITPMLSNETKQKLWGMDNALTNEAVEGIELGYMPDPQSMQYAPKHGWTKDVKWETLTGINGEPLTQLNGRKFIAFQPDAPFNREILHSKGFDIDIVGQHKKTFLVPENVYHTMQDMSAPASQLMYPLNVATSYWKSMAIGANLVGFNFRNIVGDTFLAGMMHPGKASEFVPYIMKAVNLLTMPYKEARLLKKGEVLKYSEQDAAYWQFAREEHVLDASFVAELKGIQGHSNPLAFVLGKMREIQAFRENILRMANTVWMLDKLGTPMGEKIPAMFPQINTKGMAQLQAIGEIARRWQVDYEAVSLPYQRYVRNFLIPFGLWPLKMSENVWKYAFSGFNADAFFSLQGAKRLGKFGAYMATPGLVAALWNSGKLHEGVASMPGLDDGMREEIRKNGMAIRKAEQRLNTNDRNTLHFTWGFEKGGSIKMFNMSYIPSEVLFGTKIFNKIITQASMALMGEKSIKTAMKDTMKEWLGSEGKAATIWLTPLIRYAIGYVSGKDPFDKSRVYSAYDIEKLSLERKSMESFDFALKCFIPPIGVMTTGDAKYMTMGESTSKLGRRMIGHGDPYGFQSLIGATQRYVGLLGSKPFRPDVLKDLGIQANEVSAIVGEDIIKAWIVSGRPLNEFIKTDQYKDAWKNIKELYPPGQFEARLPFIAKVLENKIKDPNTLYLYFKRRADKAENEQEAAMWRSRATMAKSLISLQSFKALPWTMKGIDYPE